MKHHKILIGALILIVIKVINSAFGLVFGVLFFGICFGVLSYLINKSNGESTDQNLYLLDALRVFLFIGAFYFPISGLLFFIF
jgi:uncharacterized membrane protein YkgB